MPTAAPFLMFQGDAEEALRFYEASLPGVEITSLDHWPAGSPGDGKVLGAVLSIYGREFRVNDSPIEHAFTFTPSTSIFIDFDTEAELDAAYAALGEGGEVMMALADHGFSKKFGWIADRFGVSWQLNLPS